jgi:nucleoside-diphosphate-sugar epimerase
MRPHILVLGANGFVGSHFVHQALQLGWKVDGAKRPSGITSHFESIKNYYENLQIPLKLNYLTFPMRDMFSTPIKTH